MRETAPQSPLDAGPNPKNARKSEPDGELAPTVGDDGLAIEDYAEKYLLPESEIWRRIRCGELLGRTHHGRLLIYPPESMAATLADLPPLPGKEPVRAGASQERGEFLALSGDRGATPELALLLDHLSLAKEENREILRLTGESLKRVSNLSEALVQMKDTVIVAKDAELTALRQQRDAEVAYLQQQLAESNSEIKRLRQHSEDLEMLAHSMAQQPAEEEAPSV